VLRTLQQEGLEILPLESAPRSVAPTSEVSAAVHEVVEAARPRSRVIQTEEHRAALREIIDSSRLELIVVSPWLNTSAVNDELLSWLEHALQRQRDLRIVIGYGIERDDANKTDWKSKDQREALKRLNSLGPRYRGRLRTVEIGNTHQKLVIGDSRVAIVTSFNWLSFNPRPGKGLRQETGFRIDERDQVQLLRDTLAECLRLN
jgi:phosphatidylserine/phosphatidylglycerophosphate/cardiolipin synthase-like enzyme